MQKALIVKVESAPNAWYAMSLPHSTNKSQFSKVTFFIILKYNYFE